MYMFKYVTKRLGLMISTFLIIMFMCFVLIKLLPITVTVQMGQDANIIIRQLEGRGYIQNAVMDPATQTWSYERVPIMIQLGNYLNRRKYPFVSRASGYQCVSGKTSADDSD